MNENNKQISNFFFSFHFQWRNQQILCVRVVFPSPVCRFRPPEIIHDLTIRNGIISSVICARCKWPRCIFEIFSFFFIEYRPPIGTKMTRSMKKGGEIKVWGAKYIHNLFDGKIMLEDEVIPFLSCFLAFRYLLSILMVTRVFEFEIF